MSSPTKRMSSGRLTLIITITTALAALVFYVDIITPLGIAGGVPYILVVFCGWLYSDKRIPLLLAFLSTILTALGYSLSPPFVVLWIVLTNRFYAIIAVWVTAILLYKIMQKQEKIREININLDILVKKRTGQLENQNKNLEHFLYIASHDLQEPLRTISALITNFQKDYYNKLDEKGKIIINYIIGGSRRAQELIHALLEHSKIGREQLPVMTDCNEIVGQVIEDLQSQINSVNAVIKTDKLPTILAYKTALRQLFQNIISNALKFRRQEISPEIRITALSLHKGWKFSVSDNGIGIEEKQFDKIFVIFQRLHSREKYPGTGIGLAHCKKIVELHNGRIWAESKINEGSTFYFTINTETYGYEKNKTDHAD